MLVGGSMQSVYIHIPFCETICTYCDFCKMYYHSTFVPSYLHALKKEIDEYYQGEKIKTIYIGGGTPSVLSTTELEQLFDILKTFHLDETLEFTFECNIENITREKLEILKKNKVNRLSIGVETFDKKFLFYLNRHHTKEEVAEKIKIARECGFDNINIDLIYAIPGQTLKNLRKDLDCFLELDIEHISTYSLMIEPHTILGVSKEESISEDLDYKMYELINQVLKEHGYDHYEVSNFARTGYESKHNLVYWNNENYYGFGLGASGYIKNTRYTNTRSLTEYIHGNYRKEKEILNEKEILENEFILGFRKLRGISKQQFFEKYQMKLEEIEKIKKLVKEGKLDDDGEYIFIKDMYIYTMNSILVEFIGD